MVNLDLDLFCEIPNIAPIVARDVECNIISYSPMGKYTLTVVYITINHGFEMIQIDLLNKYISDF